MAANLKDKRTRHVSEVRKQVVALLAALKELRHLRQEETSLGTLTDDDFAGDNDHLTAVSFAAATAAVDALLATLGAGTPANYAKLLNVVR